MWNIIPLFQDPKTPYPIRKLVSAHSRVSLTKVCAGAGERGSALALLTWQPVTKQMRCLPHDVQGISQGNRHTIIAIGIPIRQGAMGGTQQSLVHHSCELQLGQFWSFKPLIISPQCSFPDILCDYCPQSLGLWFCLWILLNQLPIHESLEIQRPLSILFQVGAILTRMMLYRIEWIFQ